MNKNKNSIAYAVGHIIGLVLKSNKQKQFPPARACFISAVIIIGLMKLASSGDGDVHKPYYPTNGVVVESSNSPLTSQPTQEENSVAGNFISQPEQSYNSKDNVIPESSDLLATSNDLPAQDATPQSKPATASTFGLENAPYHFNQSSPQSYGSTRYNSSYGIDIVGDYVAYVNSPEYKHRMASFSENFLNNVLEQERCNGTYSSNNDNRPSYVSRYDSSDDYGGSSTQEKKQEKCRCWKPSLVSHAPGDCPVCGGDGYTNNDHYGDWEPRSRENECRYCSGTGKCPRCKGECYVYY